MLFKRKKKYPMPEGATITTRCGIKTAQWVDGKGTKRRAILTDDGRIEVEMATYTTRYRNTQALWLSGPPAAADMIPPCPRKLGKKQPFPPFPECHLKCHLKTAIQCKNQQESAIPHRHFRKRENTLKRP